MREKSLYRGEGNLIRMGRRRKHMFVIKVRFDLLLRGGARRISWNTVEGVLSLVKTTCRV